MFKFTNKTTALENLDKFDIRNYDETLMQSRKFKEMEKQGSEILPSYPALQRDIWGSLYKYQPKLKSMVDKDLTINKEILSRIYNNPEFQGMREYTKLDDLASALSCLQLSDNVQDIIETVNEQHKELNKKLQKQQNQAEKKKAESEALKNAIEQLKKKQQELDRQQGGQQQQTEQQNQQQQIQQKLEQLQKQQQSAQRSSKNAEKKADNLQQQLQQQLQESLNTPEFNQQLSQAIQSSFENAKEETKEVELMLGGKEAGNSTSSGSGNILQKLELAERIKENKVLKNTLNLAGKMKNIAMKKQKTKSEDTPLKTEVEMGNNPERLLPSELLQLSNPATKKLFLKRFAEGETLQYSEKAKEKLGKGPVVVCIDISGSMSDILSDNTSCSQWAKAVAFALWTIANKQKRKFYCIEFNSFVESSLEITKDNIVTLLECKANGGTSFVRPLIEAQRIINNEKSFKKADIIFITDGCASINNAFKNDLSEWKKKTKTNIFAIQLSKDTYSAELLNSFADEAINYDGSDDFAKVFEL